MMQDRFCDIDGRRISGTATTGDITDSGTLTITGASTFITKVDGSNIVLNDADNAFAGAVTLQADDGSETFGDITFVDSGAINFNTIAAGAGDVFIDAGTDGAVGGNLSVTATTGNITQGIALSVTGTSSFTTLADNATITLDTATNALSGNVTLTTNDTSGTDSDVILDNGTTALVLDASTVDGDLTLTGGHASGITDDGTVTVGGNLVVTTDANAAVINLDTLAVDGTIAVTTDTTGDATLVNDAGLNFAASTVGGALSATATTGDITDSGALAITGTSTFITKADGSNIVLDHASNAFGNAVTLQADAGDETFGNITFVDSGAVKFDLNADADGDLFIDAGTDGAVGGDLSVTAKTGNITQALPLVVSGTSSFTTLADGGLITLNNALNALTGAVSLTTNDTSGTDSDVILDNGTTALSLGTSTVVGDLTVVGGNAAGITDSGTVTVGGNLSATTDAADGVIDLDTLAVDGTIVVATDGTGDATVVNDAGLNFASATVGGNLSATATTGDIADAGTLTVTGASTFITGASGSNIILDDASNAFGGAVTLKADAGDETFGNITFVDSADVKFDLNADADGDLFIDAGTDGAVGGNLSVTATTGNITQGIALKVTGTSSFTTSANDATITLNNPLNALTGAVTLTTNDASGTDADVVLDNGTTALVLDASTIDGDLTVTSGAAAGITDAGTLTIGGNLSATTEANNGVVTLDTLAVDGTIAVTTHGTGNATLINDAGSILRHRRSAH